MKGRRRGIRLYRMPWETVMWFVTSRLVIILAAVLAGLVLAGVVAWTRPWQGPADELAACAPIPVVVAENPGGETTTPGNGEDTASSPARTADREPVAR